MVRPRGSLLLVVLLALFAPAFPALANNVTVSGNVTFSSLDGSADDEDHTVNGVFTVSGDLVINGTISCIDDSGRESACPMSFNVGHDLIINAGGALFAENRTGTGTGAPITFIYGHDFIMHGPTTTLAGALVSSDSSSSSSSNGGAITASAGGAITIESGATIDSGSANAVAGAIALTAGGPIGAGGNVLAGPSRTILATRLTDAALAGGTSNQAGGAITLRSTSVIGPAITVGTNANIISQAQVTSAGPVTLEGCGVIVNGLVASLANKDATSRVVIRSGKGIAIDGRDLGIKGATLGRNGSIRADAPAGTAINHAIDLFASDDVEVSGPDPAGSTLFAISGTPGLHDPKSAGANVRLISLTGGVTASGNVAVAGRSNSGNQGGSIAISSRGALNLDQASLTSIGDFATNNANRAGGTIALRSYSGNVIWTNGTGDVRPTGSSSGLPSAVQGAISITACGTINLAGSTFPTNGPAVGVFPGQTTNACSPGAPSLPAGEPALPICCSVITITNPAVSTGTIGAPFSQTFTQSGAVGTATFSLASGTLPAGLTLASNGILSGTPAAIGNFPIVVAVTDSNGCTATGPTYTLVISCQTITVANPSTTSGTVDAPFSQAFTQSGALGGATFSLAGGTLPAGLTLSATGVLSGTPQVPGTFSITVMVTDGNGCTGTGATYTLVIACQTITVTNPASNSGVYKTPLSFTFTQSGAGTHTPAVFTLNSGSLPSGVTLSPAGVLSGTPQQTGMFTVTVKVTDANGCSGVGAPYTLIIAPAVVAKTYTDVGNTQLSGGLPAPATPTVVSVALSSGDSSDTAILYAITVLPVHGTLTAFNSNGTFLYTPNAGITAADGFSYTATSNGVSVNVTASIGFTGRVWYVDNATGSAINDGRSNTPFTTMTAVSASAAPGDIIYVSKGSGPTTGSYAMLAGQNLTGAGATLTVGPLTLPGATANTPTLSGTLTLADNVTVAGIDMSTGASGAITGTTISGISVTARNVTTTTGIPVSIGGIANSGTITLTQVNAGNSTIGPPNAIALSNYNGSLTVLGDGGAASNGSGGTIQGTGGDAVRLTGITGTGVSLNYMNVADSGANAIRATTVNNLTINRCNISDRFGNTAADDGVGLSNMTGAVSLTNDSIAGSPHQGVTLDNFNSNLTSLTITGTTISGTAGGDGVLLQVRGTSVLTTGTISNSIFSNNLATGLQIVGSDTSNIAALAVQNNTITGNNAGMDFDLSNAASMSIDVLTNSFNNQQSQVLNLFSSSASTGGVMRAKLQGNLIGTAGVFDSGSFIGDGIRVSLNGGTQGLLTIDGNVIREVPNARGIEVGAAAFASGSSASVKITNNQVVRPTGTSGDVGCGPGVPCPLASIFVAVDQNAAASESVCSVITGNSAYDPTSWPAGSESAYYLARRSLQTLNLEGNTALTPAQNILGANTVTNLTSPGSGDFTDESGNVVVVAPGSCGTFP